ncbi:MAG: hypothetical protein LBT05_12950 [Planctomycetaceae bacterium]|jgi:hypothetical protein|nr:hypothetical protein [Planctomycetaceae bacterium]
MRQKQKELIQKHDEEIRQKIEEASRKQKEVVQKQENTKQSQSNRSSNTPPNRASNNSSLPVRKAEMLGMRRNGAEFSEDVPKNAILVGFDVSLGKWGGMNDCIASIQPLYRGVGDSQKAGKGKVQGVEKAENKQRVMRRQVMRWERYREERSRRLMVSC